MIKKLFRYLIVIILMVLVPHLLLAEESEKRMTPVELDRMEIRGEIIRPNMVGVLPEQGGVNDAAYLLHRVPGANVNGLGPLSGIAQYRGLFGDRVNVDFKGMNYKPACTNSMDAPLSHVPAAMTSLLKVYRGIAPVSSGIETIGGAIVQETKRAEFTVPGEPLDWTGKFSGGITVSTQATMRLYTVALLLKIIDCICTAVRSSVVISSFRAEKMSPPSITVKPLKLATDSAMAPTLLMSTIILITPVIQEPLRYQWILSNPRAVF